ncbi:MAG: 1-(5-phosphoribosyl)-5-[(5-phosphoribosylamino) methylideneamino]imidazole-4-carboxamide isomerase [Anaerolineae bacterium]
MIVFPAIDLRGGRVVRLRQGDPGAETVFDDDPVAAALRWTAMGAEWLHVVNLDGALQSGDASLNRQRLREIAQAVAIPIQFGGGLRSLEDVEAALEMGAARVILGTVAVRQPELVAAAVERFGADRIVVGIDARDGRVAVQGWQELSSVDAIELARRMAASGVRRVVFTDIRRDGMLSGVNVEATAELARATGLKVIASGGVRSLDDIRALLAVAEAGIEGVITGQAIYSGALDLAEAIRVAHG